MIKRLLSPLLVIALIFTFSAKSQSLDEQELQRTDKLFLKTLKDAEMSSELVLQRYREILDDESNLKRGAWVISNEFNLDGTPKGLWTTFEVDVSTDKNVAANAVESEIEIEIGTPSTEINDIVNYVQDELNKQDELNEALGDERRIVVKKKGINKLKLEVVAVKRDVDINEDISISAVNGIFGESAKFGIGIGEKFERARNLFRRALIERTVGRRGYIKPSMNPRDDPRFVNFGIAYGAFTLAIDNNPESIYVPYALYRLGDILLEQALLFEKPEREERIRKDVIPAYETAINLYPQHIRGEYVLFWLGQFYYDRGDIETAKRKYQQLVRNYKKRSKLGLVDNALFMIADCELNSGNIDLARETLKEFADNKTILGYEAILRLAKLEPPGTNLQDKIYMDAVELNKNDPRSISLIVNVANRLLTNREFDKAIQWWELAVKRSSELKQVCPREVWIGLSKTHLKVAKIERKAGQVEQPSENLNKALESLNQLPVEELDRFTRREVNLVLASVHYYEGNYDSAIEKYETVDKELSLDFSDKYKLVRAYVETDATEKAVEVLKEQIDYINSLGSEYKVKLQDELDNSYRALVDIYLIQKNYQAAVDAYEEIKDQTIRRKIGVVLASLEKLSGLIDESK